MTTSPAKPELLAPAGEPDAAYAAFQYGADAVYVGLHKFSARAEAINVGPDELDRIVAYAHSLTPRRSVYATVNTLIFDHEIPDVIDTLGTLAECEVDAVIVQDLGVCRLLREQAPFLPLHASTQMAIHNLEGARTLKQLGFSRVTLARELTLNEIRQIVSESGLETEVFIHGALCYAYSGLCLFSAQFRMRSGNRGQCAYPCRDAYTVTGAPDRLADGSSVKRSPRSGLPFSMKDLSLAADIPALCAAGVTSLKIEGRKKSPLYVAAATALYRGLIDGTLDEEERRERERDLQTIFSRPLTRLYFQSARHKNVADPDTVGHRGTPIGKVERIVGPARGPSRLRFKTRRALEKHDGIQIDLPGEERPFGFAVDRLFVITSNREKSGTPVFEAEADTVVEVELPPGHPFLPPNAMVYCSSSQAVKRRYPFPRPKPGEVRNRLPARITARLDETKLTVVAECHDPVTGKDLSARIERTDDFKPARDAGHAARAFQQACEKIGDTRFRLDVATLDNPSRLFLPVSLCNQTRREALADLDALIRSGRAEWRTNIERANAVHPTDHPPVQQIRWAIKVDRPDYITAFNAADLVRMEELILDISATPLSELVDFLAGWERTNDRQKIRLALPLITREEEITDLRAKIASLRERGWARWEAANLSAWELLGIDPHTGQPDRYPLDVTVDWPVYAANHLAAAHILEMGASRVTLSPEVHPDHLLELARQLGPRAAIIVRQDLPLFISESCPYANLIGGCPGKTRCRFESMDLVSATGEAIQAIDRHCRAFVLAKQPVLLTQHLDAFRRAGALLRVDFMYRPYRPEDVPELWRKTVIGVQ